LSLLPRTLFGRSALALLAIFLLVQGLALYVVWRTTVVPLWERSADDLAARIALAAQTWVELPPETRADYEIELSLRHSLELGRVEAPMTTPREESYFGDLLTEALGQRTGQTVTVHRGTGSGYSWLELRYGEHLLRIGFTRARYQVEAPLAAGGVFLAGGLLTLIAVLVLARRISRKLADVGRSARILGQGRTPERLPETGAEELRQLAVAFNRMADEVQKLLENRTVLLSGISHDLRTPLTRLRLALSMLESGDPDLTRRMEGDLTEMGDLISEMMDFSRALQATDVGMHDLVPMLDALARHAAQTGAVIWQPPPACPAWVGPRALHRILANLVENAQRYGDGQPVELRLESAEREVVVQVLDRGPGIPEQELETVFQPFYRLEASRARETGGSGLGLAIVRQLADAYGWRVTLAARPGGGLVASLVIPAGPVDQSQ